MKIFAAKSREKKYILIIFISLALAASAQFGTQQGRRAGLNRRLWNTHSVEERAL